MTPAVKLLNHARHAKLARAEEYELASARLLDDAAKLQADANVIKEEALGIADAIKQLGGEVVGSGDPRLE